MFLKQNKLFIWLILFILLNLIVRGTGDANQNSRFMTMRAICNDFSLQTNKYIDWTIDWAKTPDGNYYSNKAPGPMLIGFPVFCVMDFFTKTFDKKHWAPLKEKTPPGPAYAIVITLFTQIIPFALIVGMLILYLQRKKYPFEGIYFMTLALLFGNTSALFMNTYFGHGMVAFFMVAMIYFLLKEKYFLVGLFFGLSLLSDYIVALMLPLLIFAIFLIMRSKRPMLPLGAVRTIKKWAPAFCLGGAIPALMWAFYHYTAFGGVLTIANSFPNPSMIEGKTDIWQFFSSTQSLTIIYELILGKSRGLLVTVPWILFFIPISMFLLFIKPNKNIDGSEISEISDISDTSESGELEKFHRPLLLFALTSLSLLLLLNSTFGGWHAGASPGPRYLSAIFPVFAILVALFWRNIPRVLQILLWIMLAISIILRNIICATTILSPLQKDIGIWGWHLNFIVESSSSKYLLRLIFFTVLFLITLFFTHYATLGFKKLLNKKCKYLPPN
ncbi:MAG: hypothetical protein HQK51_01710 [Oligoflexia bacterium]|nr:hypothetical protein [Oligoflexia bacterium]